MTGGAVLKVKVTDRTEVQQAIAAAEGMNGGTPL